MAEIQTGSEPASRLRGLFLAAALAVLTLGLNWKVLSAFWAAEPVAGYDGTSHLAAGEYYAAHIFPSTWGWVPLWFGGMPFPQFYPPLLYFVTAALWHVLPVAYSGVMKLVLTGLLLAVPGITASTAVRFSRERHIGLLAGALAVFSLSYGGPASDFGISVAATVKDGLFTQVLGYVCLLSWLRCFVGAERSGRGKGACLLLLSLTLVSNAHIIPIAALAFLITMLVSLIQRHRAEFRWRGWLSHYALLGLLPVAATAFWYLPLAAYHEYLATMALPPMDLLGLLGAGAVPLGLAAAALPLAVKRGDTDLVVAAASSVGAAALSLMPPHPLVASLPLQPFRLFATSLFLSCVPAGYLLARLINWLDSRAGRALAFVMLTTPLALAFVYARPQAEDLYGFIQDERGAVPVSALPGLAKRAGLMTVEAYAPPGQPSHYLFNAALGRAGFFTTYSVFRESSISSVFMTPIRNGLSEVGEAWGVDTLLAFDPDFQGQDLDHQLDRAELVGVSSIWAVSSAMKARLQGSTRLHRAEQFGAWELFDFVEPRPRAQVLDRSPAVFFGPVSFKKRSTDTYDFVRFQEEILFRGKFDVLLARAEEMSLDRSPELERFDISVVAGYRYRDIDRAFDRLQRFAKQHLLICTEDADPLFERLAAAPGQPCTAILTRPQPGAGALRDVRRQISRALDLMDSWRAPASAAATPVVASVEIEPRRIHVALQPAATGAREYPVLVKASYFPAWRRGDSAEPVYMITPSYMLTFASAAFDLTLETGVAVHVGQAISAAALLVGCAVTLRSRGKGQRG